MSLKAGYYGIKKLSEQLNLTTEGTLSLNVENDPDAGGSLPISGDAAKILAERDAATRQLLDVTVGWTAENLFNRDTCTEGYIINESGVVTESSSGYYSDYISVVKSSYTLKYKETGSSHNIRVHEYDSSKTWLRQLATIATVSNSDGAVNLQISDDAKYIRISAIDSITNISFYHSSVDLCKADNTTIAPVENGPTASQLIKAGHHFMHLGDFCTAKTDIAQGATLTLNTNYTSGDVASLLTTETAEATNPHEDITLNTTYKYAVKNGKTVNFKVKFTLANDIASGSNVRLFDLPYLPNLQYLNFIIYDAIADQFTTQFAFVGNTNGRVYVSKGLTAGGYEISGTYICQ